MKKRFAIALSLCLFALSLSAQVNRGGVPFLNRNAKEAIPHQMLSPLDNTKLIEQDQKSDNGALRIAVTRPIDALSITQEGKRSERNGMTVWQMAITSPEATFMTLHFSEFEIPQGARLFVYNSEGDFVLGSFTCENRLPDGTFYTQAIPGDKVIVEYQQPHNAQHQGSLVVDRISHGYKDFLNFEKRQEKGLLGNAGDCHINVACDEGNDWRDQIRSVVEITITSETGSYLCSGAMINNTACDKMPYMLTAYHCIDLPEDKLDFTFYFNYQTLNCEGQPGNLDHSVVGGEIISKYSPTEGSDFCLIRFFEAVPDAYQPYYAGWDRKVAAPSLGSAIHHPKGDWKKISIPWRVQQSTGTAMFSQYQVNLSKYFLVYWSKGIIEQGSSGSPLFNGEKLICGQLSAGHGDCSEPGNAESYYGRLATDWIGGGTAESRLSDWLDPLHSGATTCKGINWDYSVAQHDTALEPDQLFFYPNPSNGMVKVDVEELGEARYEVYDLFGNKVFDGRTIFALQSQMLNLTSLPSGAYIVYLYIGERTYKNKLIIYK